MVGKGDPIAVPQYSHHPRIDGFALPDFPEVLQSGPHYEVMRARTFIAVGYWGMGL